MARAFNGTTDSITTTVGALAGFASGTFAALARRTNESGWHGIVATRQSDGTTWEAYLDIAPSAHATASAIWTSWNGTDHANTLKFTQADGWCIIAATKATGSATPRYHKYVLSTQTWTHDNGVGAVANATSISGGNIILGNVAGDQLAGDIAAVAMYGRTFTDQEIESLAGSWEVWLSYGPMGAWLLDQAATAQTVLDWSGGGANQSAISGTTIQTGSVPGWNQSDGGTWVAEITAAGGTSATATPSTAAGVATVGSVTVTTGSIVPAAVVAGTAAVGVPTLQLSTTVSAGTVAAVATVGTATVSTGSIVSAAVVAAVAAVSAVTATTGQTVPAATVAGTATQPPASLSTGEIVSAVKVSATATVPAPSITAGGSTTVSPATVAATATQPAGTVSAGQRVTAVNVAAVATVGAPTVQISVQATPAVVAATAAVPAVTLHAGALAAVQAIAGAATIPGPTLVAAAAVLVGVLTAGARAAATQSVSATRTGGPT